MPSMFTPNQERLVTMLPKTAITIKFRWVASPPQRACRIKTFHKTIMSAPFSLGSHPQNGPDEAEQGCKTHDPKHHALETRRRFLVPMRVENSPKDVKRAQESRKKSGAVA